MSSVTARAERAREDKFAARRRELAETALAVIAEQGFARTGLRDVAARSALSTGVLHYYFESKDDLIAQAVWQHKSQCARRYDGIVAAARTPEELAAGVADAMAATLRDEATLHRLWYDLRNQALFEEGFRDTIIAIDALLTDMVWAIVERHAELAGREPSITPGTAYALVDGLFLNALIAHLRGDGDAVERMRAGAQELISALD